MSTKVLFSGVLIILLVYAFLNLLDRSTRFPYTSDEISWFFHTKFYEELFLKKSIDRAIWQSYEAYDHPPLAKYIFGGYFSIVDPSAFARRDKLEGTYGRWQFYSDPRLSDISKSQFAPYIKHMRVVNVAITALTIVLVILLFYSLEIPWIASALLGFVLIHNQLIVELMIHATGDSLMILFLVSALLLFIWYSKSNKIRWLVLFAVCAGLSASTKLTGVLLLIPFTFYEGILWIKSKQTFSQFISRLLIGYIVGFIIWLIVNPTLYRSPIFNTIEFFSFRIQQSFVSQSFYQDKALLTFSDRLLAICANVFEQPTKWTVLNIGFFVYGLYIIACRGIYLLNKPFLYIALLIFTTFIVLGLYLPLRWDRYYLPLHLVVFLSVGYGSYILLTRILVLFKQNPRKIRGF